MLKTKNKLNAKIRYDFKAEIWKHNAEGGWFFVSLPHTISKEIRESLKWQEEGWGRMKAQASIKGIEWDTAIWFDKKHNTYLLPLKSEIRKKAALKMGDTIAVSVFI